MLPDVKLGTNEKQVTMNKAQAHQTFHLPPTIMKRLQENCRMTLETSFETERRSEAGMEVSVEGGRPLCLSLFLSIPA